MSLWTRVANVFRGERLSRELDEEFESHMEEAIAEGRDPAEVRRAFGSMLRQREASHRVRVAGWLDGVRADAIFGWRQLRRNRVTSAAAVLSLALAMGACVSAFRLVDALLWRPLPVATPERLFAVSCAELSFEGNPENFDGWAYPDFILMREAAKGQAVAVGARGASIARLVAGSVFSMVAIGVVAGAGLGLASARYIQSLFFQVKASDIEMLAVPSAVILAVAVVSTVPGVLRALKIDPVEILRAE